MTGTAFNNAQTNQSAQAVATNIIALFPAIIDDSTRGVTDLIPLLDWLSASAATPPDSRITTEINAACTAFWTAMNTNLTALKATLITEFTAL